MDNQPVIVEKLLKADPSRVWQAITDRDEMKSWYFQLDSFRAEPGFQFQFTAGAGPDQQYVHQCQVTEVIPERKLVYSWQYQGKPGLSHVSFELFPQGAYTLLRLTHSGLETFSADTDPNFSRGSFEAGWTEIINRSLAAHVEKTD